MSTFYLIRHGEPDYSYGDAHGFIGQGHDFAPLKQDRIKDVIETSNLKMHKSLWLHHIQEHYKQQV